MKDITFAKTLNRYVDSKVRTLAIGWNKAMFEKIDGLAEDAGASILSELRASLNTQMQAAVEKAKAELTEHMAKAVAEYAEKLKLADERRMHRMESLLQTGLASIRLDVMNYAAHELALERYAKDVHRLTELPTNRKELLNLVATALATTPQEHMGIICKDICPFHCGGPAGSATCKTLRKVQA